MKFGIVYHWRDPVEIFEMAEDFLELRIFEEDIENNYSSWKSQLKPIIKDYEGEITIHMPEYFQHPKTGKSTLVDLASTDERILTMSIDVMRRLIDFSNIIEAKKILIHPGGIMPTQAEHEREDMLNTLRNSLIYLSTLGFGGKFLLENMPWFYWRRDGSRWYSNICVKPADFPELLQYCDGMVLDFSHSYLSTSTGSDKCMKEFATKFREKISYLHVSDALPPDNEGLQIGEGNINFSGIINMLDRGNLWIVPEIWKGHENFGEGFRIALERLNQLL